MPHRALVALALLLALATQRAIAQTPPCQLALERQPVPALPSGGGWRTILSDLNGNGITDVVYVGPPGQVYLLINDGAEQFGLVFFGAPPVRAVGDIDLDGDPDLVHRDGSIRLNNGFGAFFPGPSLPISHEIDHAALVDFDSDGDLDLYTLHSGPLILRVYENRAGMFALVDQAPIGPAPIARFGDVTGDGVPDVIQLLTGVFSSYTVTPIALDGSIGGALTESLEPAVDLALGDVDGSPPLDLLLVFASGPHRILLGSGAELEVSLPAATVQAGFIDVDANGVTDIYARGVSQLHVLLGLGGADFQSPTQIGDYFAAGEENLAIGDLNRDGVDDLISKQDVFWNRTLDFEDCDGNGVADSCDILVSDCNDNGVPDACDITSGLEADIDGDGLPDSCEQFLRGDANGDGTVNVTDAVRVLFALFAGGVPLSCESAGDVNDDDALDVSDAVTLLNHLFVTGVAVPAPYPGCGVDPTPGLLSCVEAQDCP